MLGSQPDEILIFTQSLTTGIALRKLDKKKAHYYQRAFSDSHTAHLHNRIEGRHCNPRI